MNADAITKGIRWFLLGFIILIAGGLVGWYFYLHAKVETTTAVSAARGLGVGAPSFEGTTGSTQVNQSATLVTQNTGAAIVGTHRAASELWEVDKVPVAGMGFVRTTTDEYLYFVERANGYLFKAQPIAQTVERLTDTLMPKIYEAQFTLDGSVIERSLDTQGAITTFLGTISTSTSLGNASSSSNVARATEGSATVGTSGKITGSYLPLGIIVIAHSPTTRALLYLVHNNRGGVDVVSTMWNSSKRTTLFSSSIAGWRPLLLSDGTMLLAESPADDIPGYLYSLTANGGLVPRVRGIRGLTVLPDPSSSLILYGSSSGGTLTLFAQSTSTPQEINLATVADKCVWLPGKSTIVYCAVPTSQTPPQFLNNWYRGVIHTSDDWWKIDISNGTQQRIYSPSVDGVSLDVANPTIDATGNYIAFTNATDQSLWVVHVAQ